MKAPLSGIYGIVAFAALASGSPVLAAGGEAPEADGPVSTLDLTYTLYVGGISVGTIDLSSRIQGQAYQAVSKLETSGVVNTIWRGKIEASSRGTLNGSK